MRKFEEKKFNLPLDVTGIPQLKGISKKNIEEHLKLYAGYVKNANLILEKLTELKEEPEKNAYAISEIQRRFSFEYNGIRNHEIYFNSFSGGSKDISIGRLKEKIDNDFDSFEKWLTYFKSLALTRGIGWAMLYYDRKDDRLLNAWIDEQHIGQLQDCAPILALDMWEHAFILDYQPSGKKDYIEDFFANLNWEIIENNFIKISK